MECPSVASAHYQPEFVHVLKTMADYPCPDWFDLYVTLSLYLGTYTGCIPSPIHQREAVATEGESNLDCPSACADCEGRDEAEPIREQINDLGVSACVIRVYN